MMDSCVVLLSPAKRLLIEYLSVSRVDLSVLLGRIWKLIVEVCLVFSDQK
jgi:hypothetical protein